MTTYQKIAAALPRPAVEQTRAFARYITGAHSWYKHLRVLQDSPFYFYLDPNAGCDLVIESEDQATYHDCTEDSKRFHYTWQTTESYRRRFGHWNYAASRGRSFMFSSAIGVTYTGEPLLAIGDPEAGWIDVPETLQQAGTAYVNALMWDELGSVELSDDTVDAAHTEFCLGCFGYVPYPPAEYTDSNIQTILGRIQREARLENIEQAILKLPSAIAAALPPIIALWSSASYLEELRNAGRPLVELMKAANRNASSGKQDQQNPYTTPEYLAIWGSVTCAWEQTQVRQYERSILEPLIKAILAERQRQVDGMVTAMICFIEKLDIHP